MDLVEAAMGVLATLALLILVAMLVAVGLGFVWLIVQIGNAI